MIDDVSRGAILSRKVKNPSLRPGPDGDAVSRSREIEPRCHRRERIRGPIAAKDEDSLLACHEDFVSFNRHGDPLRPRGPYAELLYGQYAMGHRIHGEHVQESGL